ncbi:hypothetical protein GEMRC1_009238 [Eukaryota sp. GEM-RC1]
MDKKQKQSRAPQAHETLNIDPRVDFASWYTNVCLLADIIDKRYPVKGMYTFKPYGWYMHEAVMRLMEDEWLKLDIEKTQFPMLIPEDFLTKEGDHIKGFEDEVFWVTKGGKDVLETRLALRPTSETCIYHMFSLWIRSFRDLPVKVHQSCSVFRCETKDTKPLIRTREVFWNEAHTAHATAEEALQMLNDVWASYVQVISHDLGVFGLRIRRPEWDKFAGADHTDVMDALMPCGRVLQIVGAHYLGQKFSQVFNVEYQGEDNQPHMPYITCFGVSTRVLASVLGIHGDVKGLVLPPKIARFEVVIVPIIMGKKDPTPVLEAVAEFAQILKAAGIRVTTDCSSKKPGEKFYYWEMKGVPLRMEIGPRDVAAGEARLVRRDTGEKNQIQKETLVETIQQELESMRNRLAESGKSFFTERIVDCNSMEEIKEAIDNKCIARIPFHSMDVDGKEADRTIHEFCGAEVRGYDPTEEVPVDCVCVVTGKPAKYYGYCARSY